MAITFYSLSGRLLIFISLNSCFGEFVLFFGLKLFPLSLHFACLCVFFCMYEIKQLPFSVLKEWSYVGVVLCGPGAQSPLATRAR